MTIYERIIKLADRKNISIFRLERKLGFGNGSIKKWNNAAPASDRLYDLADYFEVDPRYLLKGEIKSDTIPAEHQELLNSYNRLTPEKQNLMKSLLTVLEEDMEQGILKEEKKEFILRMLKQQIDEAIIKEVAIISDEELEVIKQEFINSK